MAGTRNDVIVVGTRVAGAATAMLLARKGVRVLAVDRARFPSDTLSTHQVQLPGVVRLNRWGLLDRITAAGTPATRRVRFDPGHVVLEGRLPAVEGVDAIYSPRRTLLDSIMVDAARAAGAEVREGFSVEELMWSDGRVAGVRGRERGGQPVAETARLVIGADGKHSTVATAVSASAYGQRPVATMASYSYWSGVAATGGELYQRPGRAVAAFPTSDGLTVIFVSAPRAEFPLFRTDIEGQYLKTLDMCGDLGDRVRAGDRAERFRLAAKSRPGTWCRRPREGRRLRDRCEAARLPASGRLCRRACGDRQSTARMTKEVLQLRGESCTSRSAWAGWTDD